MYVLNVFATLLIFSLANTLEIPPTKLEFKDVELPVDKELLEEFLQKYEEIEKLRDEGAIVALINEYADTVFGNIPAYASSNGLDPISIPDVSEKFLTASIKLTEGSLGGISTVVRDGDVQLTYGADNKLFTVVFPVEFSDLSFKYHYKAIILLIGPHGSFTAQIEDFRTHITIAFDFANYRIKLESLETKNTGHITLKFDGSNVLVTVVNIITEFVTSVLHSTIVNIIQNKASDVVNSVVNNVNDLLSSILNPGVYLQ